MKTLFIIDGAYQDAKKALLEIIDTMYKDNGTWRLIKKYSTKKSLADDMIEIDASTAVDLLSKYRKEQASICDYFCYNYPILDSSFDVAPDINGIKISDIDAMITDSQKNEYGFLIARNEQCIKDLIEKYETNGQINVVPVFLYTDFTYITKGKKNKLCTATNKVKCNRLCTVTNKVKCNRLCTVKWEKLFKHYTDRDNSIKYENVLIMTGDNYNSAKDSLEIQIKNLIKRVGNKNSDMFVVTESDRYFLPIHVRGFKEELQKIISKKNGINEFNKRVFLMMKFKLEGETDEKYDLIKSTLEDLGYECVRADNEFADENFQDAQPDQKYWLCTYLCKYGLAFYENATESSSFEFNSNVTYEMGVMKQQGKKVLILVPNKRENEYGETVKMFFDIRNEWSYSYLGKNDIVAIIKRKFPKINKHDNSEIISTT